MSEKQLTGYASQDKPWQKYYSEEALNGEIAQCKIYDYLWSANQDYLDGVALIYYGRKISFKDCFHNIESTAKAFVSAGVKAGDYVTICSVNTPEVVYAIYALNRIGAVANLVDPRTNTDRIAKYMKDANSRFVLTLDKALPRFNKLGEDGMIDRIVVISPADSLPFHLKLGYKLKNKDKPNMNDLCWSWSSFINKGIHTDVTDYPYEKDYPVAVVYTGGTTGIPKGAVLSNDAFNAITYSYNSIDIDVSRNQRYLNIMPPFIAYGISCGLNMPLCHGITTVLIPQFDPEQFADLLQKYKPQHIIGVPSHFEKLMLSKKAQNMDLSFLKSPACGGDSLIPEVEQRINSFLKEHNSKAQVIKGYGMTELGSAISTTQYGKINKIGSVGLPYPKNVVTVRDPKTREELTYNVEGEFYISSPSAMTNYINAPEEQEKVFWTDENDIKWVKTGDVGYIDEDGFIFLKGRMKRMIVRPDGHNVWPSMIEAVIVSHPLVEQCVVVGCPAPNTQNGKTPTAFIKIKQGCNQTDELLQDIEAYAKEHMPERDTASVFRFIDEIPMTNIGKVDYRSLEEYK